MADLLAQETNMLEQQEDFEWDPAVEKAMVEANGKRSGYNNA